MLIRGELARPGLQFLSAEQYMPEASDTRSSELVRSIIRGTIRPAL
jgi:hypothetical protein